MPDPFYLQPKNIKDLGEDLKETEGCILAGGTDILPGMHRGMRDPKILIDISKIDELKYISLEDDQIEIGALTTYDEIIRSPELKSNAPVLCVAASSVGAFQTRQRGTIGGSIGNASPAGDILIALLVLNAKVTLMNREGSREVAIQDVFISPGKTCLHPDEFIHHISFEVLPQPMRTYFRKIGKREAMACSVAGTAVVLDIDQEGVIQEARIALGSVAPTPVRAKGVEDFLKDKKIREDLVQQASEMAGKESSPIDDVRGTAGYRRTMIEKLVRDGLTQAGLKKVEDA
jgi:carbon-monoxide dehydrogenase medium subunit